jgi:hypothetical protein
MMESPGPASRGDAPPLASPDELAEHVADRNSGDLVWRSPDNGPFRCSTAGVRSGTPSGFPTRCLPHHVMPRLSCRLWARRHSSSAVPHPVHDRSGMRCLGDQHRGVAVTEVVEPERLARARVERRCGSGVGTSWKTQHSRWTSPTDYHLPSTSELGRHRPGHAGRPVPAARRPRPASTANPGQVG